MTGEKNVSEFIDKYLAHVERKDSREGATKWVLLAAIAALCWKIIDVVGQVTLPNAWALLALFLVLYWLIEISLVFGTSKQAEHKEPRFFSRDFTRPADAKRLASVLTRLALTSGLFAYAYIDKTVSGSNARVALWLVIGPMLLIVVVHFFVLLEIRKKYFVSKKMDSGKGVPLVACIIFVVMPIASILFIDRTEGIFSSAFRNASKVEFQFSVLCCGILFLLEKYTHLLRADGEAAAVRRIWRRLGMAEINDAQAHQELKLIIAGASLSEVVGSDVEAFMRRAEDVQKNIESARQELAVLSASTEGQEVVRDAVRHSLQTRLKAVREGIDALHESGEDLIAGAKRMLDGEDDAVRSLKRELDEKVRCIQIDCDDLVEKSPPELRAALKD